MPPDIRSFFGGGSGPSSASPAKKDVNGSSSKKQRSRKVVSDDEEEVQVKPKKTATKKQPKREKTPEEETTTSAYFASNKTKSSRSTPLRPKSQANGISKNTTPSKASNGATPSTGRRSARATAAKSYAEDDDDVIPILKDESEGNDDVYAESYQKTGRKADDYEAGSDEEVVKTSRPDKKEQKPQPVKTVDSDEDDDIVMAEIPEHNSVTKAKRRVSNTSIASSRKRKSKDNEENDDNDDDFLDGDDNDVRPKKKSRKASAKSSPKAPRAIKKTEPREENKEIQAIFDAIPTIRAPTPPPRGEDNKFDRSFIKSNAKAVPVGEGSKEMPEGAENCLAGLSFVFTGVLDSIGRDEGIALVKRYGGKSTTAPSKKTSYVVLGSDAGPKKLETIQQLGIKTVNEDGLFELIRRLPANGGDGVAAEQYAEKKQKDEEKIKIAAAEMEKREKERKAKLAKQKAAAEATRGGTETTSRPKPPSESARLWVDKYAPDTLSSVCGNKGLVEKLQNWLRKWHTNARFNFKKAGADGNGVYRAAMLHGPPGIGKTTAAHLVAKLEGFDVVESNASDTRSKRMVEDGLKGVLDTTSLLGFFAGDGQKVSSNKKNLVLIMDEVDGMSAGDRGGVGALAAIAKKTHIPMILICNERRLPKMRPFDHILADFPFRRPSADMIRPRIMTILFREGLKVPPQVVDQLIEGSNADIRQIINMISTVKLDNKNIDFNDSRAMAKAWEKHVILKPWDLVSKILRPQMFSASSTATINDKIELYFNDHEFSSLMLQENYLKTVPTLASSLPNKKQQALKLLDLADNAASSISDGDLVDRLIRGSQQWSLMPTHAVFSFVKPASYVYGNFTERVGFSTWLGQNSKYGKLTRFVKEIQGHMRLRASGTSHEVRQQYMPMIWSQTIGRLRDEGKDAAQSIIDFMDSYYLTKDDFDSLLELGVGEIEESKIKIETSAKAAFTRTYNLQSHPMPFIKASTIGAPSAKGSGGGKLKPDLEEAVDESEDDVATGAAAEQPADDAEGELDLKKDKYISAPKKRKAPAKSTAGTKKSKGKGKGKKAADDDDNDDSDEDAENSERPSKAAKKSKAAAAGGKKGKSKKN